MFVGVARLVFQVPGSRSLKERRRVIRSFKERARARLAISVAEVGDLEQHQRATVGAAVVALQSDRCREVLANLKRLAAAHNGAVLADIATEVVPFGHGGDQIRGGIESPFDHAEPAALPDFDGTQAELPAPSAGSWGDFKVESLDKPEPATGSKHDEDD